MILPACPVCGTSHGTSDTDTVGRFRPEGPLGWRARNVPGAPIRATRAEAIRDVCGWAVARLAVA